MEEGYSSDYIKVYDSSSIGSSYLGTVQDNNQISLVSTSNYMTVVFSTDNDGVAKGFTAEFLSTGTIVVVMRADMTLV